MSDKKELWIKTKEIVNDDKGYTCTCGKYHKFPAYVYAHTSDELLHTCDKCGLEVHIYDKVASVKECEDYDKNTGIGY